MNDSDLIGSPESIELVNRRLSDLRRTVRALPVSGPPALDGLIRRRARRRGAVLAMATAVIATAVLVGAVARRDAERTAADPRGIGVMIGETPWRLMLVPDGWTASLVDDDTTVVSSAEGQDIEISAELGERPPSGEPIVIGPLADGYTDGATVFANRMGWTLEIGIPGNGRVDTDAAIWLLQSIGRVDIVAPFASTPLPAELPDVVGLDYRDATEQLLAIGARSEWRVAFTSAAPPGTVVSVKRLSNRLALDVAAVPDDMDVVWRYEGGFLPFGDTWFVSAKWGSGRDPFRSRPPLVFLEGEIVGAYADWDPNGNSRGFASVQAFRTDLHTSENGRIEPAVAETGSPVTTVGEAASAGPAPDTALVNYRGLRLDHVLGWTILDERASSQPTSGCPIENTVLLRERSGLPAPIECLEAGVTLPANWLIIEPVPADLRGIGANCSDGGTQAEDGAPMIRTCEKQVTFATGGSSADPAVSLPMSGSYRFFNGIDALVSASGNGEMIAPSIVYSDGHSDQFDGPASDFTAVALADLGELRPGGGGCAALLPRAAADFDLGGCEQVGTVNGEVAGGDTGNPGSADSPVSQTGVQPTNINPQLDAYGTMIVLDDNGEETPYLLAHRWEWNPETLAGEWRIVSIERYVGAWPPPDRLPGRPPSASLP